MNKLKELIEFQRELIARETTITGRQCKGVLTEERDLTNNRVLVKDIVADAYSISSKIVGKIPILSLSQNTIELEHAWIDHDLIVREEDGDVMFEGDVKEYERLDGSKSYGFVKLHELGSLSLKMASSLAFSKEMALETAFKMTEYYIDQIADALDKNKNMCLIYINPYLLQILFNEHYSLKQKVDRKNGILPKKRKKKKAWNNL